MMMRPSKLRDDEARRPSFASPSNASSQSEGKPVLGLLPRTWYILFVAGALLFITRVLFAPSSQGGALDFDPSSLRPHDYLNNTESQPDPFDFCPVFGPGDVVGTKHGQMDMLRTRLHTGSGARVQRVINKALGGHPVTISILGGSIAACHGAGDDPVHRNGYAARLFKWWNSVFPHPANELTNGALRRTDSAYYAFCNSHHLPDRTDLVILDFDTEDPNDREWLSHFELLVRSILTRPDTPAVIILGHFSPQLQAQNGFAGPELLHTVVAQFYDVPHISIKGLLYHDYLSDPDLARATYFTDPMLANANGHELLSEVIISYLQSQICAAWNVVTGRGFDFADSDDISGSRGPTLLGGVGLRKGQPGQDAGDGASSSHSKGSSAALRVPPGRLADLPSALADFREAEPFCVSASDLINPLPPSLFYGSGWKAHHPANQNGQDRHYWYSEIGGSRLRVPLKLGAGDVGIYYIATDKKDEVMGSVTCWVDDNVAGGVDIAGNDDVGGPTPTLKMIDSRVSAGSHFVECMTIGEEGKTVPIFKMLGIFAT